MPNIPIAHWRAADGTPQYLHTHLRNVGELARSFAAKLKLQSAGELIGLLHDLGKYSAEFQRYIGSALGLIDTDSDDYVDAVELRGKVDHSTAGAQYVWRALGGKGQLERITGQILPLCIASHHSGLIDCVGADISTLGDDTFGKRMRKLQERTHLDEVHQSADVHILDRCSELLETTDLNESLRALIERILHSNVSGSTLHRRPAHQPLGLTVRFLFSCLIDADRIDTADFEHKLIKKYRPKGEYVAWPVLVARLERRLKTMQPACPIDALRSDISTHLS